MAVSYTSSTRLSHPTPPDPAPLHLPYLSRVLSISLLYLHIYSYSPTPRLPVSLLRSISVTHTLCGECVGMRMHEAGEMGAN